MTICYALINVSYLTVMSPMEMITSEAVAVTFGNRLLGVMAWLMPLSVTISTFGSANGTLFAAGRLCFAASREGHLLDILSYVHIRRYTPAPGLIFHVNISPQKWFLVIFLDFSRWLLLLWYCTVPLTRWLTFSASLRGFFMEVLCWLWLWCDTLSRTILGPTRYPKNYFKNFIFDIEVF